MYEPIFGIVYRLARGPKLKFITGDQLPQWRALQCFVDNENKLLELTKSVSYKCSTLKCLLYVCVSLCDSEAKEPEVKFLDSIIVEAKQNISLKHVSFIEHNLCGVLYRMVT